MSNDLVPTSGMGELTHGLRNPSDILREATIRATALKEIVTKTNASLKIGKNEHLRIEAWITIGQFYNCTARCKETEAIEVDGVPGFKARAQLTHDETGMVLGEAEAYCMRDEDRWNTRSKYEWQNGSQVKVGEERVPTFQLASMAQTRAMSKVLASKFRWVVVLAGYAATPAEEMTGNEYLQEDKPSSSHSKKSRPAPKLAFGRSKGKEITDTSVPNEDLAWMLDYIAKNVGSEKRKQYERQDREMMSALEAELKKREGSSKPQPPAMDDDAWVDCCRMWLEQNEPAYADACIDFKITDASTLAPELRTKFQLRMKELMNA